MESMGTFYMHVKENMMPLNLSEMSVAEIINLIMLLQMVNNCTNNTLRQKALKDGLSLKDFLDNSRAYERAKLQ